MMAWLGQLALCTAFLGVLGMGSPAGAVAPVVSQAHRIWIGLDLDLDDATGCTLDGADASGPQSASGLEWSAELSIDPTSAPATVTQVYGSTCDEDDVWGLSAEQATVAWAVGSNNGENSGDVVEFGVDASVLGLSEQLRLVVFAESAGGHRDTLSTLTGTASAADIAFPIVQVFPALSPVALLGLALLFAASGVLLRRASFPVLGVWLLVVGLASSHAAWALTLSLDGLIDEWVGIGPIATDAAGDSETNDPSADILALFVDWDQDGLAVRIDIAELEAELCAHSGTDCVYVSASGTNASDPNSGTIDHPWQTLGFAVTQLDPGARLLVYAGDYEETERIIISDDDIDILGEDGVTLQNTIDDFEISGGWMNAGDPNALEVYVSTQPFEGGQDVKYAWGSFQLGTAPDAEEFMLIPYMCYEALAAAHHNYPSDPNDCTTRPYAGPGLYWDEVGLVDPNREGHIYARVQGGPGAFDAVIEDKIVEKGWSFSVDPNDPNSPNDISMKITLNGPFLQINADNVSVANLTLENGSFRMGGDSVGNNLHSVTFDGPSYHSPIEFYSGGSEHTLQQLSIDSKFPPWVSWQDTKQIFQDGDGRKTLMYAAITLNARGGSLSDPNFVPIHHVALRESTIQNVHDGYEMISDSYHHMYVVGSVFHNVQDDSIQMGSSSHDIEIGGNVFTQVGNSVSRHGTGANSSPGRKYIHHNFIDASTEKYYCREDITQPPRCPNGEYQTLRAFNLHNGDGWGQDGDARYYYNNTVVVYEEIIGIGLHGQKYEDYCTGGGVDGLGFTCDMDDADPDLSCQGICFKGSEKGERCTDESECDSSGVCAGCCSTSAVCTSYTLPYGQPSLVFNNVFVQLDPNAQITKQSPKWSILAPPTLILDGNLYYRPAIASPENDPLEMSGKSCEIDLYRDELCVLAAEDDAVGWTPQLSPEWEFSDAIYSWGIEPAGLFDDTDLDPNTYIPSCAWLNDPNDPNRQVAPVDLTAIDGAYTVTTTDPNSLGVPWELALEKPLPGVDGSYRGYTPCE